MRATTYRKFLAVEDQMLRGSMPRTSAADPVVVTSRRVVVTIANRGGLKLVKPLTATIAEAVSK